MAKKGKAKISKVKRNNQTTNKMKKQGKLRLQRHRTKVHQQKQPAAPQPEYSSESEASGDEWADMLDDEEQKYIMKRLANDPTLLSSVPDTDEAENKPKQRKHSRPKPKPDQSQQDSGADTDSDVSVSELSDSDADIEDKYEKEQADKPIKKTKPLLPIKTRHGVVEQEMEIDDAESDSDTLPPQELPKPSAEAEESDSGMEGTGEEGDEAPAADGDGDEVVTAVRLLAERREMLNKEKLRIGALCSSLLESPDKKLKNLYPIMYLMEEQLKDGSTNLHSVRKIATLSAFEVFCDILPDYQIRHQDYSNVKLKKETLTMYKYEKELLEFYKRYLQRLEKATNVLRRKKGDTRKPDPASENLALVSLRCMCGLLTAKPNFNYSVNVAQSLVPLLGSRLVACREEVAKACAEVFRLDNKGELTLTIVRLINQLVKRRGDRLPPSALDCLLHLRIRDVELDAESDIKHKQRQEEKHKKRIVNLSKKEKKRAKKLKEVEQELLETEAQESTAARNKLMTEVTRTVFHIYFRLLKTAPHSKLLAAVLTGLTKFTHVINLEFYTELVAILGQLLSDSAVSARSRLLCARAALAVLSGAGDALNVDPARFHHYLYAHMLDTTVAYNHEDAKLILETLTQVTARVRRVSSAVLVAFAKRLATLATQLSHNGALAAISVLYHLTQQSKQVAALLEPMDETVGSGRFDPHLPSPEHCNASATALYELTALARHYHPLGRTAALLMTASPPALPKDLIKLSPTQIFDQYDGSQLSFKPAIPPPKRSAPKTKHTTHHLWAQSSLRDECLAVEESVSSEFVLELPNKKSRKR